MTLEPDDKVTISDGKHARDVYHLSDCSFIGKSNQQVTKRIAEDMGRVECQICLGEANVRGDKGYSVSEDLITDVRESLESKDRY